MNDKEWGTPISRDKIIYRRNKLIEYQRIGELRFTPLYETIDENILDINYMIYEIDKLQSNWNSLREWLKNDEGKYFTFQPRQNGKTLQAGIKIGLDMALDKMNELEGNTYEEN